MVYVGAAGLLTFATCLPLIYGRGEPRSLTIGDAITRASALQPR